MVIQLPSGFSFEYFHIRDPEVPGVPRVYYEAILESEHYQTTAMKQFCSWMYSLSNSVERDNCDLDEMDRDIRHGLAGGEKTLLGLGHQPGWENMGFVDGECHLGSHTDPYDDYHVPLEVFLPVYEFYLTELYKYRTVIRAYKEKLRHLEAKTKD
jgi:hypothetical protein